MLKSETTVILLLLLSVQPEVRYSVDWTEVISCGLSFLGGLSVNTWIESRNNTLTSKTFLRRLLLLFGFVPMVYYVWTKYKIIVVDVIVAIFVFTALCEWIASLLIRASKIGFKRMIVNYLKVDKKDLENE